jgi:hypothetical protein
VRATRRLVTSRFLWPKMASDVNDWARQCLICQQSKIHKHIHPSSQSIPIPSRRFSHLHIDLVGPLPISQGCTHLLTMVDRTTRWLEAVPLASTTAQDCAEALCTHWVARFGVPSSITSDRGPQFMSSLWANLSQFLPFLHIPTTAFHPQSNGLVERFHRRMKAVLRARCTTSDWVSHLPWVLLALRTSPHELTDTSPAEALFGTPLVLPAQFPASPEDDHSDFLKQLPTTFPGPLHKPSAISPPQIPTPLLSCPMVFVQQPPVHPSLSRPYQGPFLVLQRFPHAFKLQIGHRT